MTAVQEVLTRPVAHRGLHDLENGVIENSMSAFRRAIDGAYAIECDLQLSADGVPMVFHDDVLDRVTAETGPVGSLTASQLNHIPLKNSASGDTIPLFSDFLDLVDGQVALFVELKDQIDGRNAELARAAAKELARYSGPTAIISFAPDLLTSVRRNGFKGPRAIIVARFDDDHARKRLPPWRRFHLRHMLHYPWTRFDFVDSDHKALDLPMVRLFRALGFPVASWTIRSQEEADMALTLCDQIAFENFVPRRG